MTTQSVCLLLLQPRCLDPSGRWAQETFCPCRGVEQALSRAPKGCQGHPCEGDDVRLLGLLMSPYSPQLDRGLRTGPQAAAPLSATRVAVARTRMDAGAAGPRTTWDLQGPPCEGKV